MTPAARTVAEILWRHHTVAHTRVEHFADEAAEILAALEPHRRRELKEAHRRGSEEAMEEARSLPPLAASSPTGTPGATAPALGVWDPPLTAEERADWLAGIEEPASPTGTPADHPHTDPGDGRTECERCGKYVWPAIHSCKGIPVTDRARARAATSQTGDATP